MDEKIVSQDPRYLGTIPNLSNNAWVQNNLENGTIANLDTNQDTTLSKEAGKQSSELRTNRIVRLYIITVHHIKEGNEGWCETLHHIKVHHITIHHIKEGNEGWCEILHHIKVHHISSHNNSSHKRRERSVVTEGSEDEG